MLFHVVSSISIGDLQVLKYTDNDGETQRLYIIERAKHKWRVIADKISDDPYKAESVSQRFDNDPLTCLRQLLLDCFIDNLPASGYSQDWIGFVELIKDVGEEDLAKQIEKFVTKCKK